MSSETAVGSDREGAAPTRDEAIELLWDRYYVVLVRMATGLTCDRAAAEEVVQEGFATLLRRWRQLRDPSAALAYLHRVVVNEAHARRRHQQRLILALPALRDRTEMEGPADTAGQLDLLAALAQLPARKRACVVLRFYADLPEAEVARLLHVSVGTVKSQTARGLRQLAVILKSGENGDSQ